jgi:hypothetical protein
MSAMTPWAASLLTSSVYSVTGRDVGNDTMGRLVVDEQRVLGDEHALFRVAGLGGLLDGDVIEHAKGDHAGIDQIGVTGDSRACTSHLAVGNNRDRAEVGQIHIRRGDDRGLALLRGLIALRRHVAVSHEGREDRLGVRRDHQGLGRPARIVGRQDRRIQERLGHGALGAVGRSIHHVGRGVVTARRTAASTKAVIARQPCAERARLAVGGAVARTGHGCLVGEADCLHVDAQLDALLGDFAGQFRLAAGLRGLVLGTRDNDLLVRNLRVVTHTRSRDNRIERPVVAFRLVVAGVGGSQGIGLPLGMSGGDGLAADQREEGSFLRRNHIDFVGQFFAISLRVVSLVSVGNLCH